MYEDLKKKRIEIGKTLEEIAEQTKIKKSYLKAIEERRFDELPVEVYARAYIKAYAEAIRVDPSLILKDYDEYLKTKKQNIGKIETEKISKKKLPSWSISGAIILGLFIFLFLIFKTEKQPTIPPPPPVTQEVKIKPPQSPLKLSIAVIDNVWMRIIIDDKEKKEFLLNPGEKIELQADKSFKLHIGNAGGVKVLFNGNELGKLGELGQVVHIELPQEKN